MPVHDDLGVRMKTFYEQIPKTKLMRRCPVAIRIDGKAFHTFTRGFQKPFDEVLIKSMQETMKYLCENIQGCVLGYAQSDEITLILVDYKKLTSSAWFDYEVQKMCSIAASMATIAFNKFFIENVEWAYNEEYQSLGLNSKSNFDSIEEYDKVFDQLEKKYEPYYKREGTAMFDARCFNILKEEVTNLIYWRQLDAIRNSIQMVGQANFSQKELQNKSCKDILEMLSEQKNIAWDNLPVYLQRGSCCIKMYQIDEQGTVQSHSEDKLIPNGHTHWLVCKDVPLFKDAGREYIDKLIMVG